MAHMNPCDTNYAVPLSSIAEPRAAETCELCGARLVDQATPDHELHTHMEQLRRLAEWLLWSEQTNKGLGSVVRVMCAKLINPTASLAQIGAAVGLTKDGARTAADTLRSTLPHIHAALWPEAEV